MIKKALNILIPILIFFSISLVLALPYYKEKGILAIGETSMALNNARVDYFSTWEDKTNLGTYQEGQNNIYLFTFIWEILGLFKFTDPSILWLFLSFFLPGLFFYLGMKSILKIDNSFVLIPGSLLYAYNPFRFIGTYNYRLHLLFIFLPVFFVFYYKLLRTQKWKYVVYIMLTSLISSSMASNAPVFTIPYFLMCVYLIYSLLTDLEVRQKMKRILIQNLILLILIVLVNLFWIIPLVIGLLSAFAATDGATKIFQASGAGFFFDHLRILGSWAWRGAHYVRKYYTYYPVYDAPLFLLISFSIPLISLIHLFEKKQKNINNLRDFSVFLFIISFLLLAGNKGPLGFLYGFIYKYVPLFQMFREPFTKFTPLFVFSLSIGLIFSTQFIFKKVKNKFFKYLLGISITTLVLVNTYPLFTTEAMTIRKWNSRQYSYIVKIPQYWKDVSQFFDQDLSNWRVVIFPHSLYGTHNNWEYGITTSGNAADYLINKPLIRGNHIETDEVLKVSDNLFRDLPAEKFAPYLRMLNVRYVLQENDREWRYSKEIAAPSVSNAYLQEMGLKQVKTFGMFTDDYLSKILNEEPDEELRQSFYDELRNQPALVVYEVNDFLPHVYSSNKIVVSNQGLGDLPAVVEDLSATRSAIILADQNQDKEQLVFERPSPNSINSSTIEYKKVHSTKYKVSMHLSGPTVLVLSENFHPKWQVYSFSEPFAQDFQNNSFISEERHGTVQNDALYDGKFFDTWFKKSMLDKSNHLKVNGYANGWYIDPESICSQVKCQQNDDGSYDLFIILEFKPQRLFVISFVFSSLLAVALILLICYFLFYTWRTNSLQSRTRSLRHKK